MPMLTNTIIEAAIEGLAAKKQSIDTQIAELRAMLTGAPAITPVDVPTKGTRGGKRKVSPEALERMREGQRRRWAKAKGTSAPATKTAAKPKRKMSAAGKKAIAAAQKKRWAAKKAAA